MQPDTVTSSEQRHGDRSANTSATDVVKPGTVIIGNFDVLLEEDGLSSSKLRLVIGRPHVGNNRFQVLLTMNSSQYESHTKTGQDTEPVIERIIDIVCRQVVPNGRFLLRNEASPSEWNPLSRDRVRFFVRELLDRAIDSKKPRPAIHPILAPPAPAPAGELPDDHTPGPRPDRAESSCSLPVSSMDSLPLDEDNEDLMRALEPVPFSEATNESHDLMDGEKKRRRRSSLLRRSASESILLTTSSGESEFDKKKSIRKSKINDGGMLLAASFVASLEEEQLDLENEQDSYVDDLVVQSQKVASPSRKQKNKSGRRGFLFGLLKRSDSFETKRRNIVTTAEPLDVIFQDAQNRCYDSNVFSLQQHTGNNRLNVFMNLQMERYKAASLKQRTVIIQELQETVRKHWRGRFLMETPEPGYAVLSEEDATNLLMSAFDERLGLQSADNFQKNNSKPYSRSLTSALPEAAAVPAATDVLKQSRAVQSLQKRKKRLGLTSRIRNLSASTRTALTRSTSEPARRFAADSAHDRLAEDSQDTQMSSSQFSAATFPSNGTRSTGAHPVGIDMTSLSDRGFMRHSLQNHTEARLRLTNFDLGFSDSSSSEFMALPVNPTPRPASNTRNGSQPR